MQSKTSFFNLTVFKKDLTRFWVIPLLYFVTEIFAMPASLWASFSYVAQNDIYADNRVAQLNWTFISHISDNNYVVDSEVFCLIAVMAVFGYLYSTRNAYMMHAFPLTRTQMFVTGIASSFTMVFVPQLLVTIITSIVGLSFGVNVTAVWVWLGCLTLYDIFFIGLASVTAMLTGLRLVAAIFFGIFNFVFIGMDFIISVVKFMLLAGFGNAYNEVSANFMTPSFFIQEVVHIGALNEHDELGKVISSTLDVTGIGYGVIYAVVGIAFMVLACFLYNRKQIETVSDFITVKPVTYLFKYGFSFFTGLGLAAVTMLIITSGVKSISYNAFFIIFTLSTLFFAAIVYMFCQMLLEKSFRVVTGHRVKYALIYMAVILVFLLGFRFDILGMEKSLPKAEEVDQILIANEHTDGMYVTSDKETIAQWIDLHKELVKNRAELRDLAYGDTHYADYISINYRLTNGKVVSRQYVYTTAMEEYNNTALPDMDEFLKMPEIVKTSMFGVGWEQAKVTQVVLTKPLFVDGEYYGERESFAIPSDQYEKIFAAVLADIDAKNMPRSYNDLASGEKQYLNMLNVVLESETPIRRYYSPYAYWDDTTDSYDIYLNPSCTNTINALINAGVINSADDLTLEADIPNM